MKFTLKIDKEREEEVIVFAHEKSALTERIKTLISTSETEIFGYKDKEIIRLDESDIYCFYLEDGKLYAMSDSGIFRIKMRLFELEEKLSRNFIKINQSSIANLKKIERFGVSFGASLTVHFKNGYTDYVSRRRTKAVKERLGF